MAMDLRARKPGLLLMYVAVLGVLTTSTKEAMGRTIGPIFIFGDSTMDVGTNSRIENCTARADHLYYGIDYPWSQATGRFSNGLNTADTVVQLLGGYDKSPLPYLALVEDGSNFTTEILNGANFASGGDRMGARKFGIMSIPPIGCCPVARSSSGACSDETNSLARACHASFESLLKNFSSTLKGFKYSLGNTYNMTMNIITKPIGFKDVTSACCADKTPQGLSECKKGVHLCKYRDDYLFWDAFHPTQKASKLAATALVFSQDPDFVSPINFGSLRKA